MRRRLPWILLGALLLTLSAAAFLLATDPGLNSLISLVSRLSGGGVQVGPPPAPCWAPCSCASCATATVSMR